MIITEKVTEPFSVNDLGEILNKSPAFLSKHCDTNPGKYEPYFKRVSRGRYSLIEKIR